MKTMSEFLLEKVPALEAMRKYPDELYYSGNTALLSRVKLSIVGSRRADGYSRFMTSELSAKLSRAGVCIVSGGAMGGRRCLQYDRRARKRNRHPLPGDQPGAA